MPTKKQSYTELRKELDDIISWFENEDLDVDEATKKYEKALLLAKEIEAHLTNAENTIRDLKATTNQ